MPISPSVPQLHLVPRCKMQKWKSQLCWLFLGNSNRDVILLMTVIQVMVNRHSLTSYFVFPNLALALLPCKVNVTVTGHFYLFYLFIRLLMESNEYLPLKSWKIHGNLLLENRCMSYTGH